jgi:hypothetical protein
MAFPRLELTGFRSGRLVALREAGKRRRATLWLCLCDCGNEKIVSASHLHTQHVKSCGCLHKEAARTNGRIQRTHGLTKHPLYRTWIDMHKRCRNPNDPAYKWYGARGIKVCRRWTGPKGFPNFLADMDDRPAGLSLDRCNNEGNYTPSNCHWATHSEQAKNRRRHG